MTQSSPAGAPRWSARERAQVLGEARLSDADCVALVIATGRPVARAEQLAHDLLRESGGLAGLAGRGVRELRRAGVGPAGAAALVGAVGLARRLEEQAFRPGRRLRHGGDVARLIRRACCAVRQESFFVVTLDVRSRVLGLRVVSVGVVDAAPVHPREVFGHAVREAAAAVVVAHNHPSGDPTPSAQDRAVTERLQAAGKLLGISVLDHVVVGADRYYSFAEDGYFPVGAAPSA